MHPLVKKIVDFILHNPDLESDSKSTEIPKEESTLERSMKIFDSLVKNKFNIRVFSSDNSEIQINTAIPSIEKYIQEYGKILQQLQKGVDLNGQSVGFSKPHYTYLKSFFEASDGYYASPSVEGVIYASLNLSILKEYRKLEELDERTFTENRNLRLLKPVISMIISQAKELDQWTFEKQTEDSMKMSKAGRQIAS